MSERRWPTVWLPVVVAAAAVWSVVPLAIWWDGANPAGFLGAWTLWWWGSLVVILGTVVLVILSRGGVAKGSARAWDRLVKARAAPFVGVTAAAFALLAVAMCLAVFAGNPRNVDGFAELFQARIFLTGHLWVASPPEVANFATLQMILEASRWFSQYPPGQSAVLAAGLALGAWWLLNPLFAALLVWATWRVGRWCAGESVARLAIVLLCVSPFAVAVAGSEMSHLSAATIGMLAAAAACGAGGRRSGPAAFLAGLALGIMTAFRPLDAIAAAVPVGFILLLAAPPDRRIRAVALTVLGGVLGTLPLLAYNQATTGSWHVLGYTYLWGPEHSLGFHPVPWGIPLTLKRAIARSGLDLYQLNTWMFDVPAPILVIAAIGWIVARRSLGSRDAAPVLGAAALVAALFTYWHRDIFYGPRFLFSALPWFALLIARGVAGLRRAGPAIAPDTPLGLAAVFAVALGMAVGLVTITPGRIAAYRAATPLFDLHPDQDARRAGISHAVVVIPDGWGTRLIVRMWALGVPVRRSTRLYGDIDACALEQALDAAERDPAARAHLLATLERLAARRRPGVMLNLTEDPNLRLPADSALAPACQAELDTDRRGFLEFAPFLYLNTARLDGDIVWARDMGSRNEALFRRYAGRGLYRYAPTAPGASPTFTPLPAP